MNRISYLNLEPEIGLEKIMNEEEIIRIAIINLRQQC